MRIVAAVVGLALLNSGASAPSDADAPREILTRLYMQQNLPVDARSYGCEQINEAIHVERVTFATQYGMRVPAIVYVPEHIHERAPGIVIVAGHGGDKTSWYEVYAGLLYASAGAVVVTYDPIGEGERNIDRKSETRAHDAAIPGLQQPERLGGLMVQDVLQAQRYLRSRPDVDATRTATLAYSMGTLHAAIAAALNGPSVLVLSGGGNLDGPDQYWETGNKINCQIAPWKSLNAAFHGEAGVKIYSLIDKTTATLVMNGTIDSLIIRFNEQEPWFDLLRAKLGAPPAHPMNLPETRFYEGIGHRPSFVNRDAAMFLAHKLRLPNWHDEEILRFPTVTAHDWTKATGVRIAAQYDTPESEGGVPALDLKLPGLTRAQLQAVPEGEWQSEKTSFILEGWIAKALADEHAHPQAAAR